MDNYLPMTDAAELINISVDDLNQLVRRGKIKAAKFSGEILVKEDDVLSTLAREERPEFKAVAHLIGVPINLREAGRKYGIPGPTISRWVKKGLIAKIGQNGQRVLLDEADVAYCATIYKTSGSQGKWLFNPDGTPYQKEK